MKAVLRLLTGLLLLTTCSNAQNVFNPRDSVYTYDSTAPAGSNTNPYTPPINTMAKWVRSARLSWDAGKFKCYYYNGMAFRLRFPNNYDSSGATKYPLIVFYHGGGEIGPATDNEIHLYWGAQLFEQRINAGEWNGFLLFPQETSIGWDEYYFSRVNAILDTLQRYNNLDPDRVIASGLSSGGYGAMAHAQAYPKRVATIIAASPVYVNSLNNNLGGSVHIPLWIANGGTDINPDPYQVNTFISSFIGAGGNCYQTYLADEGHNTWVFQWALMDINNHDLLSGWWNKAHKAQPLVYYNNNRFCTGKVNARLGITPGYAAYEWQRDNGGGFAGIPGAVTNEYQATQPGRYRVRFQRDAASGWSAWSPNPVVLSEKACTADTLFTERFEEGNPFYYADASYKPAAFDCRNGVFTSSTYNITLDGSGKTGGRFLLHNTNGDGGCTYTGNDVVWRATAPVTVTPNTDYEFCFYLANRSTGNNAKIVPAINGVPVADSFVQSPGSGDGSWTKFRLVWNSGSATSADLALFNKDTATAGNDFAIDEISFGVPFSGYPNQPPIARAGADTSLSLPKDSIILNGSASTDPDGHIVSYAWTKISGPASYTITRPDSAITQVNNLVAGVYAFRLLVTDNSGATAADTIVVTVHAVLSCGPLPPGVFTTDITAGTTPGSACFTAPGTYDVKGAGDLSGFLDKFRFVYRTLTGDGVATVKVTSQDAVSPLNRAGIMFRESLNSRAAYTLLALSSGNGVYLQSQSVLGLAPSVVNTGADIKAPYYLRLVRKGSSITGSISKDSIKWKDIGKKTIPTISKTLYIGLAVYSHSDNVLSEAVFDNWTIQGETVPDGLNPFVYPNPTNGGFVLEFRLEKKQRVWITLTSGADGRICYTEILDNFSGHYRKNLDQLRLAKGSYAVNIRTETGTKTIILVKY